MQSIASTFDQRLAGLKQSEVARTLVDIRHGVERETLRIKPSGKLSQAPHPTALGSALTHESITTDFSESLLEFITPPRARVEDTLAELQDIHKFVLENLGDESLWPMSMPCFIAGEDEIPIAQYGSSNVAQMKSLYRKGLKHRYGSMMQAIAGVHFNFSLPKAFWQAWLATSENQVADKDTISAAYFGLLRNYRRWCWLIPYLYGASPALCGSFLQGKQSKFDFRKLGKGTYYLPYATSLRMSDLGYTNSAQSGLNVCYNKVDNYIASLRAAINTPSAEYQKFEVPAGQPRKQLNANVLQIENELYSPIRPKQPTRSLEKPTDALADRGVEYIEVRALDVNPFTPVGIDAQQFYFLDVFLLTCVVAPSPEMDKAQFLQADKNLKKVVTEGRDPALLLEQGDTQLSLPQWAEMLFAQMRDVAKVLDQANGTDAYSQAIELEWLKVADPTLTPSAKILSLLQQQDVDNGAWGKALAEQYKAKLINQPYQMLDAESFERMALASLQAQQQIEEQDSQDFEAFLQWYFGRPAVGGDASGEIESCA